MAVRKSVGGGWRGSLRRLERLPRLRETSASVTVIGLALLLAACGGHRSGGSRAIGGGPGGPGTPGPFVLLRPELLGHWQIVRFDERPGASIATCLGEDGSLDLRNDGTWLAYNRQSRHTYGGAYRFPDQGHLLLLADSTQPYAVTLSGDELVLRNGTSLTVTLQRATP